MYGVIDIARYIIRYCKEKGYYISNLKLQKILYFGVTGKREKFSKILKGGGCSSPILFAFFTPTPPRFGRVR